MDGGEVGGTAVFRAVEVDDVQSLSAHINPSERRVRGVVGIDGLLGVIALIEPNTPAAAQVYGGYYLHAPPVRFAFTILMKLRYIRKPTAPLFSGWNCTAAALFHATALQNSMPYSVAPATTAASAGSA